jgi:hypothetical protein
MTTRPLVPCEAYDCKRYAIRLEETPDGLDIFVCRWHGKYRPPFGFWKRWKDAEASGEPVQLAHNQTDYGQPVFWQWGWYAHPSDWSFGPAYLRDLNNDGRWIESPHRRTWSFTFGCLSFHVTRESSQGKSIHDKKRIDVT